MSNIISFTTRQPITQDNNIGSKYFRTTSSSKPIHVCAKQKRAHIMAMGWEEYVSVDMVIYFSPYDGEPYYLDNAYYVEVNKERSLP